MEPFLAQLPFLAAEALVRTMTTDSWGVAKQAVGRLWHRFQPDRASGIDADLAASQQEAVAAQTAEDPDTERELTMEWQGRLRRLLAADPSAGNELAQILEEVLRPATAAQEQPAGGQSFSAVASGHGRVFQAGRDQNINPG